MLTFLPKQNNNQNSEKNSNFKSNSMKNFANIYPNSNYRGKNFDPNFKPKEHSYPGSNYKGKNFDPDFNKKKFNIYPNSNYRGKNFDPNFNKNKIKREFENKVSNYKTYNLKLKLKNEIKKKNNYKGKNFNPNFNKKNNVTYKNKRQFKKIIRAKTPEELIRKNYINDFSVSKISDNLFVNKDDVWNSKVQNLYLSFPNRPAFNVETEKKIKKSKKKQYKILDINVKKIVSQNKKKLYGTRKNIVEKKLDLFLFKCAGLSKRVRLKKRMIISRLFQSSLFIKAK